MSDYWGIDPAKINEAQVNQLLAEWESYFASDPRDKDTCPVCRRVQANVNNPVHLARLKPYQWHRHRCLDCGFLAR